MALIVEAEEMGYNREDVIARWRRLNREFIYQHGIIIITTTTQLAMCSMPIIAN